MHSSHARGPQRLMLLALTLLTVACSTPSPTVVEPPTIPPPPAAMLESESEASKDYSQRVLDWLQKARRVLGGLTPSSQPCKSTPASGKCL